MKRIVCTLVAAVMLALVSGAALAQGEIVHGYLSFISKDKEETLSESRKVEGAVTSWEGGSIKYAVLYTKGLFVKKYVYTVIFSGPQAQVANLVTTPGYDGDLVAKIALELAFRSQKMVQHPPVGNPPVQQPPTMEPVNDYLRVRTDSVDEAIDFFKDKDFYDMMRWVRDHSYYVWNNHAHNQHREVTVYVYDGDSKGQGPIISVWMPE